MDIFLELVPYVLKSFSLTFYKTDTSHVLKTGKNLKTRATRLWTRLIIGGNSVGRQLHACVFRLEETL